MKGLLSFLFSFTVLQLSAQELYVFSEPASTMPARSVSAKITDHFVTTDGIYNRLSQRIMPQVAIGINKQLTLMGSLSFSNMHTPDFRYESFNIYGKYRFLSNDDLHSHFRMAVFAAGSSTNAPFHYNEISLMGDKSGVELGLIATQLWNKLALSATVTHTQVLDKSRNNKVIYVPERLYQAMNYNLSAGYLLLPREYKDYRQTNLTLYTEFFAEQSLDKDRYCIDMAPAVQLLFNSNTKLNLGHRFQLDGNMTRMSKSSWLISVERTFLGAFRKK